MKVEADLDLCQGHAMCSLEAPDVFDVPRHGTVRILMDGIPENRRGDVESAVRYCPTRALRIVEDRSRGDTSWHRSTEQNSTR
ncbi:ferredoxin [Rhodococcus indonesiensis]|uniref:ferredoxin n=1 Tax=Rhodococcus indonesiensis TaxID=3055869 RepID=UPI0039F6B096